MIHIVPYMTEDFEKLASGERTFISINKKNANGGVKRGDYIAVYEYFVEEDECGRSCMFIITDVCESMGEYLCSVSPCRIDEHRRISAPIYGSKEERT